MTRNWIETGPRPPRFLTYVSDNAIPVHECCLRSSFSNLGATRCVAARPDNRAARRFVHRPGVASHAFREQVLCVPGALRWGRIHLTVRTRDRGPANTSSESSARGPARAASASARKRRRTGNAAAHPSRHVTRPARTRSASPPGRPWLNVGVMQQTRPSCYTKVTAVDLIHSPGGADPCDACPSSPRPT